MELDENENSEKEGSNEKEVNSGKEDFKEIEDSSNQEVLNTYEDELDIEAYTYQEVTSEMKDSSILIWLLHFLKKNLDMWKLL